MKVWFYPQRPGTWSKTHLVLRHLGWEYGTAEDHDIRGLFSNRSLDKNGVILDRKGRRTGETTTVLPQTINGRCTDVRKSRIDKVFAAIFGYSSLVDPATHDCVEKTEIQAIKSAIRKVPRGTARRRDFVYQRNIDTRNGKGQWVDFRCLLVGHRIHGVIVKRKGHWVFGDDKAAMEVVPASHVFSKEEIEDIERMSFHFGCDFADLDVLRDRKTRRIYVVDVNYTAHRNSVARIGQTEGPARQAEFMRNYSRRFELVFSDPKWRVR